MADEYSIEEVSRILVSAKLHGDITTFCTIANEAFAAGEVSMTRLLIALAFLAPFMLQLLFGPTFVGAANALRILGAAAFLNVINNHFRYMLLATNRQHIDLRNSAITAVTHVGFKALLIPLAGIEGAAFGMLFGELSVLIIGLWSTRTDLRTDLRRPSDV